MDDKKPRLFTIDPTRLAGDLHVAFAEAEAAHEKLLQSEKAFIQSLAAKGINLADYIRRDL